MSELETGCSFLPSRVCDTCTSCFSLEKLFVHESHTLHALHVSLFLCVFKYFFSVLVRIWVFLCKIDRVPLLPEKVPYE